MTKSSRLRTRPVDVAVLAALAHPVRMRLVEALTLDGPATAAHLAAALGEPPLVVRWHLMQLAEQGIARGEHEGSTGAGLWEGRWRLAPVTHELDTARLRRDPDTRPSLRAYLHGLLHGYAARVEAYLDAEWDPQWRSAGVVADWHDLRMSAAQLAAMNDELLAVVARHADAAAARSGREGPDEDRHRVVVQVQSFPWRSPRTGSSTAPQDV